MRKTRRWEIEGNSGMQDGEVVHWWNIIDSQSLRVFQCSSSIEDAEWLCMLLNEHKECDEH